MKWQNRMGNPLKIYSVPLLLMKLLDTFLSRMSEFVT